MDRAFFTSRCRTCHRIIRLSDGTHERCHCRHVLAFFRTNAPSQARPGGGPSWSLMNATTELIYLHRQKLRVQQQNWESHQRSHPTLKQDEKSREDPGKIGAQTAMILLCPNDGATFGWGGNLLHISSTRSQSTPLNCHCSKDQFELTSIPEPPSRMCPADGSRAQARPHLRRYPSPGRRRGHPEIQVCCSRARGCQSAPTRVGRCCEKLLDGCQSHQP